MKVLGFVLPFEALVAMLMVVADLLLLTFLPFMAFFFNALLAFFFIKLDSLLRLE